MGWRRAARAVARRGGPWRVNGADASSPNSCRDAPDLATKHLCAVCVDLTGVSGAGIMLMSGDLARGSVCTTDDVSALIEELQYSLGEGPCVDAYHYGPARARARSGRPEHAPLARLHRPGARRRRAGRSSASRSGSERCASERSTCTATDPVRSPTNSTPTRSSWPTSQPRRSSCCRRTRRPASSPPSWRRVPTSSTWCTRRPGWSPPNSMSVSVRRSIRLRAHAFGNDRPLTDVAHDVVARMLRFDAAQRRERRRDMTASRRHERCSDAPPHK